MDQAPTPEEAARVILAHFRASEIKPGEILMRGAVELKAMKHGLTAAGVSDGLQYAVEHDWLDLSGGAVVRLTAAGFREF